MNTASQLSLEFVSDLESLGTPLAQVIRVSDDGVVAQVSMHLASDLEHAYQCVISKGADHFNASDIAINTMFHYSHLVNKQIADERIFTRTRKIKDVDYRDLHEGDVLVLRSGKRLGFKAASLKGTGETAVLTIHYMDDTSVEYNGSYEYRLDNTPSICDIVSVERKEWCKC